jgi:hypothetical protein
MAVKMVAILARTGDSRVPDWTKQTHDPQCFIVLRHGEGAWEYRHRRKTWLMVDGAAVPSGVGRCQYCGGGR